jgi:hypothetical protein
MTTLIIATRNAHKVQEIRAVLGEAFRYLCLKDFPEAPKVVEDQPTFAKNAAKKARELTRWMQRSTARPVFTPRASRHSIPPVRPQMRILPTRTTTPSSCVCSPTFRRRNAPPVSAACSRSCR